jgi:hypothetical protein
VASAAWAALVGRAVSAAWVARVVPAVWAVSAALVGLVVPAAWVVSTGQRSDLLAEASASTVRSARAAHSAT